MNYGIYISKNEKSKKQHRSFPLLNLTCQVRPLFPLAGKDILPIALLLEHVRARGRRRRRRRREKGESGSTATMCQWATSAAADAVRIGANHNSYDIYTCHVALTALCAVNATWRSSTCKRPTRVIDLHVLYI